VRYLLQHLKATPGGAILDGAVEFDNKFSGGNVSHGRCPKLFATKNACSQLLKFAPEALIARKNTGTVFSSELDARSCQKAY
jgi:hypothetical protein